VLETLVSKTALGGLDIVDIHLECALAILLGYLAHYRSDVELTRGHLSEVELRTLGFDPLELKTLALDIQARDIGFSFADIE
jgi:hypothetical protein